MMGGDEPSHRHASEPPRGRARGARRRGRAARGVVAASASPRAARTGSRDCSSGSRSTAWSATSAARSARGSGSPTPISTSGSRPPRGRSPGHPDADLDASAPGGRPRPSWARSGPTATSTPRSVPTSSSRASTGPTSCTAPATCCRPRSPAPGSATTAPCSTRARRFADLAVAELGPGGSIGHRRAPRCRDGAGRALPGDRRGAVPRARGRAVRTGRARCRRRTRGPRGACRVLRGRAGRRRARDRRRRTRSRRSIDCGRRWWRRARTSPVRSAVAGSASRWVDRSSSPTRARTRRRARRSRSPSGRGGCWPAPATRAYADRMELVLHNAFLAGVSLGGDEWFYANPLAATGEPSPTRGRSTRSRSTWRARSRSRGCRGATSRAARRTSPACSRRCPGYCYGESDAGLWVHLYGASRVQAAGLDRRAAHRVPLGGTGRAPHRTGAGRRSRRRAVVVPARAGVVVAHRRRGERCPVVDPAGPG